MGGIPTSFFLKTGLFDEKADKTKGKIVDFIFFMNLNLFIQVCSSM